MPRGAILKGGDVTLVLAEEHEDKDDQAWKGGRRKHQPTLHLQTVNLEERFASIGSGDHVVIPPQRTHWGAYWFVVADPDGNLVAFNAPPEKS